jgi:hypothetical protein
MVVKRESALAAAVLAPNILVQDTLTATVQQEVQLGAPSTGAAREYYVDMFSTHNVLEQITLAIKRSCSCPCLACDMLQAYCVLCVC